MNRNPILLSVLLMLCAFAAFAAGAEDAAQLRKGVENAELEQPAKGEYAQMELVASMPSMRPPSHHHERVVGGWYELFPYAMHGDEVIVPHPRSLLDPPKTLVIEDGTLKGEVYLHAIVCCPFGLPAAAGKPKPKVSVAQIKLDDQLTLAGGLEIRTAAPPKGLRIDRLTGLLVNECMATTRLHIDRFAEAPRALTTPGRGDMHVLFPAGQAHTWGKKKKVNDMYAVRSADGGRTWTTPKLAWKSPYNQHAWNPLIVGGGKRIVSFAMEGAFDELDLPHSGPLGIRTSDDDGSTWSSPAPIRPVNCPDWKGVCHMQVCRTPAGTWLLGTYEIRAKKRGRADRQFVLRSTDRGKTWLLIGKGGAATAAKGKPEGWYLPKYDRMLEGLILSLGGKDAVMFTRTSEGHLWELRSADDGLNWSAPKPTALVHPDAPPMIYPLRRGADGGAVELIAFIHNRPSGHAWKIVGRERQDLWCCRSTDGGRTWTEPRFVMADAAESPRRVKEVSYCDLLVDGDVLHLFLDHQKRQIVHVRFKRTDLDAFPTAEELLKRRE